MMFAQSMAERGADLKSVVLRVAVVSCGKCAGTYPRSIVLAGYGAGAVGLLRSPGRADQEKCRLTTPSSPPITSMDDAATATARTGIGKQQDSSWVDGLIGRRRAISPN